MFRRKKTYSPSLFASRTGGSPVAAAVEQSQQSVILTPQGTSMNMNAVIERVIAVAEYKLAASTQKLAPHQYPTATLADNGQWMYNNAGHWTSGFFVGCLWQLHALTGKPEWAAAAQRWQEGLNNKQRSWQSQHDFGFIYLPSFAHSYSVTQSAADLRQALAAAESLAWNWNPATKSLRTFEGWEPVQASKAYKQIVIIGEGLPPAQLARSCVLMPMTEVPMGALL
ncbi:Six-hairpin glycosidase-like protein [Scenedesmus sp. NREL 46B-D3]|nr:Six-hairpin glycosidase-like protein [Scenedesmus sp. NREL 46B-D3]